MKNNRIFYVENCHFLVVKFSVYLNRRVFLMNRIVGKKAAIAYAISKGAAEPVPEQSRQNQYCSLM